MTLKLLIADDDATVLVNCMRGFLAGLGITEISTALTPADTLEIINESIFDFVFLDISFSRGKTEGIDLISQVLKISPSTDIIMTTSYADPTVITKCMHLGASDYIVKENLGNHEALRSCIEASVARSEKRKVQSIGGVRLAERVGASFVSQIMQRIYSDLVQIRNNPRMHVLITGETGVGKELIAKAISRVDENAPYYPINSCCFGKELLEGELFGHEKGSFTGADKLKIGIFELADGGDIFLDEVATLSLDHQAKLLRVLQSGEFFRVGGSKLLKTSARVIAATNEDLKELVRQGKFREDLLQRLQRFHIHIPPLRERKEDISLIVQQIIDRSEKPQLVIGSSIMDVLNSFDWPRNVRQLEDVILSAIMVSDGKTLTIGDLPKALFNSNDTSKSPRDSRLQVSPEAALGVKFDEAVDLFSANFIRSAIDSLPNPVTLDRLGASIGMSKSALQRRLKDYSIDLFATRQNINEPLTKDLI